MDEDNSCLYDMCIGYMGNCKGFELSYIKLEIIF